EPHRLPLPSTDERLEIWPRARAVSPEPPGRRVHLVGQPFVLGQAADQAQDGGDVVRAAGTNRDAGRATGAGLCPEAAAGGGRGHQRPRSLVATLARACGRGLAPAIIGAAPTAVRSSSSVPGWGAARASSAAGRRHGRGDRRGAPPPAWCRETPRA